MPFVNVDTHSHTHTKKRAQHLSQGCMRMAPSSLMTSPLIMGFSASDVTMWANSAGSPRREGKGTWRARKERTFSGSPARRGVENRPGGRKKEEGSDINVSAHIQTQKTLFIYVHSPGAIVMTLMPMGAKSRAIGRVIPTMPPLEAEYAAWPTWRKENGQKIKLINRAINELFHLCVSSCVCIK